MNIVHIYDGHEAVYNGEGSVPDVVWNLAQQTASDGHSVTVIERRWNSLPKSPEHEGVKFRRLDLRTGPDKTWDRIPYEMVDSPINSIRLIADRINFAVQTLNKIRSLEYDILHVHLPFAANVLVSIAPWLRKQMIYTAHIGETQQRVIDPTFSPDVYLAKRAARTIVLNPEMKSAFEYRGVPSKQLCCIPNGVDMEQMTQIEDEVVESVVNEYGIQDRTLVLFAGTITPRKGVTKLIEAATEVVDNETVNDVRFIIAGKTDFEPDYTREVRQMINDANVGDSIILPGYVSRSTILALYEAADIFVLPSFEEGSSIALSEAIAAGTPIVASDIAGNAQQIQDGKHGYLVEPGDEDELANRIAYILAHREKRMKMQDAIGDLAEEHSWGNITKRYIEVYNSVR